MMEISLSRLRRLAGLLTAASFLLSVAAQAEPAFVPKGQLNAIHAAGSKRQRTIIGSFFEGRREGTFVDVGSAH